MTKAHLTFLLIALGAGMFYLAYEHYIHLFEFGAQVWGALFLAFLLFGYKGNKRLFGFMAKCDVMEVFAYTFIAAGVLLGLGMAGTKLLGLS